MLRGNAFAKIDDKGRLKVPSVFRTVIEPKFGNEFYVTSVRGDSVLIYPMEVFTQVEERLIRSSKVQPLVDRYRSSLNYYGQQSVMDAQGRIAIHPLLRDTAALDGEVTVLGQQNYLEVWSRHEFEKRHKPLSDEELRDLADLGF